MKKILALLGVATLTVLSAPRARAQTYPTRPVQITVPFAAGGVADITVRIVSEKLGEKLGQRFVIQNLPGAGGISAARAALSAAPDGYTLALLSNGTAISVPLFKSLPFDPLKDFAPISTLGTFDFVMATNSASPYRTLGDILKFAREQPGKLNVGTINVGSSQNLSAELFKSTAGIDFTTIPYRATPEVMVALLRDDVQVMIDNYAAMKSGLDDQKLRPLATTGGTRSEVLPDVPTAQESGVKDYDVTSWNALFVSAAAPAYVAEILNKGLREVLVDPDVKTRLLELGISAKASSPDELRARLRDDIAKWSAVIERAGIAKQ
jgi:tripartite-type tricarboxylate transporter receptor subunit TctC